MNVYRIAKILSGTSTESILDKDSINEYDKDHKTGFTPLLQAIDDNNVPCVKLLLSLGADPNIGPNPVYSIRNCLSAPLHVACKNGNDEIVRLLLSAGAKIFIKNSVRNTPLYYAISGEKYNIALMLLEEENKLGYKNINKSAMIWAVKTKNIEMVKLVYRYKQNLEIDDGFGYTPLYISSKYGPEEIVSFLIEHGTRFDHNVFSTAIERKHNTVMKTLIDKGVDMNRMIRGSPPLNYAMRYNNEIAVKILIDNNVDVNFKSTSYDLYPLEIAILGSNVNMTKILLSAGANIYHKTKGDMTLLDFARNHRNYQLNKVIDEHLNLSEGEI